MTNVNSFATRDGKVTLVVGQIWKDHLGLDAEILEIAMGPVVNVKLKINNGVSEKETIMTLEKLIAAISQATISKDVKVDAGKLTSDHLLKLEKTIAVGQLWEHYKGDIYTVTEIAVDANDAKDFNKAIICYRKLSDTCQMIWSLPVSEWLKLVELDGVEMPRFKRTTSQKASAKRRNIIINKSLYQYWKDIVKF